MSDTVSLTDQLAARVNKFLAATNLSQKELARLLRIEKSHFSRFLCGKVGLSAETTLKLLQLMNLSARSLQLKFGNPEKTQARLLHLQESGRRMQLSNDGWVAGQSGTDPNDSTGIDSTPTARDTDGSDDYLDKIIPFLKDQQSIYRQAIAHIDNYLANVQRGKVNRDGSTSPARRISDNDASSKPGSRGDLLSDPDRLREHLAFVQGEREKAGETVKLQRKLEKERELLWAARVDARRK